jgi:hypothetical protein
MQIIDARVDHGNRCLGTSPAPRGPSHVGVNGPKIPLERVQRRERRVARGLHTLRLVYINVPQTWSSRGLGHASSDQSANVGDFELVGHPLPSRGPRVSPFGLPSAESDGILKAPDPSVRKNQTPGNRLIGAPLGPTARRIADDTIADR